MDFHHNRRWTLQPVTLIIAWMAGFAGLLALIPGAMAASGGGDPGFSRVPELQAEWDRLTPAGKQILLASPEFTESLRRFQTRNDWRSTAVSGLGGAALAVGIPAVGMSVATVVVGSILSVFLRGRGAGFGAGEILKMLGSFGSIMLTTGPGLVMTGTAAAAFGTAGYLWGRRKASRESARSAQDLKRMIQLQRLQEGERAPRSSPETRTAGPDLAEDLIVAESSHQR